MSYTNGESLMLTRIRTSANYNTNNTTRNDWSILNDGKNDHYAILKKLEDPSPVTWPGVRTYHIEWTTIIEVWQRVQNDDDQAAADCHAEVLAIINVLQNNPRLGDTSGTIVDSSIRGIGGPVNTWLSDGGPIWAMMEIYVTWIEQARVTFT